MHWTEVKIRVPEQPFLSTEEVAALAGVKGGTIRRWVREGHFPAPRRPGIWSGLSVGIWLAWQEYISAGEEPGDKDDDEGKDESPETPVKRKSKIPDVA